jgi:hypothetical protein
VVRESSGEQKKPRGAPEWRARVRKDTGSALKALMTKTYSPSRRSAPFGETEKENGRRPGAWFHRVAERWLKHVPQKWEPVLQQAHAQANAPGLFDIVKKAKPTPFLPKRTARRPLISTQFMVFDTAMADSHKRTGAGCR